MYTGNTMQWYYQKNVDWLLQREVWDKYVYYHYAWAEKILKHTERRPQLKLWKKKIKTQYVYGISVWPETETASPRISKSVR